MECGHEWVSKKYNVSTNCPHCGYKLTTVVTQRRKVKDYQYFSVLTTYKGWQIMRIYYIQTRLVKGDRASYCFTEVIQRWLNPKGKEVTLARLRTMNFIYYDLWRLDSSLEVRKNAKFYHQISNYTLYPRKSILAVFKRNGYTGDFYDIPPMDFLLALLDNRMETLLKAGHKNLFRYFIQFPHELSDYWATIRIVLRHKYEVVDADIWCDLIALLRLLGKDIRNPLFVCPENVFDAHDTWRLRLQDKRAKEMEKEHERLLIERKIKCAEENENFIRMKGKYFGLQFEDELICVSVLDSIDAYLQEGETMKHCVFENEYYNKADSLVLSARIADKPIETIEFSLHTLQVVQSRGVCNQTTEYHDRIINLVNNNAHLIAERIGE